MKQKDDVAPFGLSTLQQVAALPFRFEEGKPRVLLVTWRGTHRWLIPKGWPMKGKKNWAAAAQEAREEAGVIGKTRKKPIGEYVYMKRRAAQSDLCRVEVYAMTCEKLLETFREKGQRELRWFDLSEAAESVDEPGLTALLRDLDLAPFQKPTKRKSALRGVKRLGEKSDPSALDARAKPVHDGALRHTRA